MVPALFPPCYVGLPALEEQNICRHPHIFLSLASRCEHIFLHPRLEPCLAYSCTYLILLDDVALALFRDGKAASGRVLVLHFMCGLDKRPENIIRKSQVP